MSYDPKDWTGPFRCDNCGAFSTSFHSYCEYCREGCMVQVPRRLRRFVARGEELVEVARP